MKTNKQNKNKKETTRFYYGVEQCKSDQSRTDIVRFKSIQDRNNWLERSSFVDSHLKKFVVSSKVPSVRRKITNIDPMRSFPDTPYYVWMKMYSGNRDMLMQVSRRLYSSGS